MSQGARGPKSGMGSATTTRKATKAEAPARGQAKTSARTVTKAAAKSASKTAGKQSQAGKGQAKTAVGTVTKAAAKSASKKAAKQSQAAAVKAPVSSPVLRQLSEPAGQEAATGGTVGERKAAATLTGPEVDLPQPTGSIYSEEIEERIRRRAYEFWERRGRKHGRATQDWLEAEKEIGDAISNVADGRPGKTTRVTAGKKVK
jgi:hypothetical protein